MASEEKNHPIKEAFETQNQGEAAYGLSEWFGAIFHFLLKRGKIPFAELADKKLESKNVRTGYLLIVAFVFIMLLVLATLLS